MNNNVNKYALIIALSVISQLNIVILDTAYSKDDNIAQGTTLFPRDLEYIIGPEDVIEISVWKNAELSKTVIVRPDGMISLPLIGDIKAGELTPDELRNAIIEKLKEYKDAAVVSVIVQEANYNKVFILGGVSRPGTYVLKRKTSILQAIALAGGFTQFASRNKIVVIRQKGNGGKEEKMLIRFDDIVDIDNTSDKNIILKPGDTVFVP